MREPRVARRAGEEKAKAVAKEARVLPSSVVTGPSLPD